MGTWKVPTTDIEVSKLKQIMLEIEEMKDELFDIAGDDELLDSLDSAIKRIQSFIDAYNRIKIKKNAKIKK